MFLHWEVTIFSFPYLASRFQGIGIPVGGIRFQLPEEDYLYIIFGILLLRKVCPYSLFIYLSFISDIYFFTLSYILVYIILLLILFQIWWLRTLSVSFCVFLTLPCLVFLNTSLLAFYNLVSRSLIWYSSFSSPGISHFSKELCFFLFSRITLRKQDLDIRGAHY